jgi:D-glycero-alpha-D-manno-heptose 1-phosphate guanylyltransferase
MIFTDVNNTTENNAITEAVILAGGLGTRLRSAVPNLPKCMAAVNGKPFIQYVIDDAARQGIKKIIFSLGYMADKVISYLKTTKPASVAYDFEVEPEPLDTGGAIKLALQKTTTENVLLLNGDTIFKINLQQLAATHLATLAACTLALKPMKNFDRYGMVEIDEKNIITNFKEKQYTTKGNINGGVYLINTQRFMQINLPAKFSFEKDYLQAFIHHQIFAGYINNDYFIDIGIPADYKKAQTELK